MPDQPTVITTRSELADAANGFFELAGRYNDAKSDAPDGPNFRAWCGYVTAATYTWLVAGMLRIVAEDHGEEYAAKLVALVKATEDDGEAAFDANYDLIGETR